LLVSPNPRVYQKLVTNRPHSMAYAASCRDYEETVENKTVGFWSAPHTNAFQDDSVNRVDYVNSDAQRVQVPCGSLTPVLVDLLTNHQNAATVDSLPRVHFFSLDTEGMEPNILRNINFNEIFVDILISEMANNHCTNDECVSRKHARHIMINENGYLLYMNIIEKSDLYIHPQSPYLSKMPAKY
jgi:hypothetical protein